MRVREVAVIRTEAVVLLVVVEGPLFTGDGFNSRHEDLRPHCSPLTTTLSSLGVVLLLFLEVMRAKLAVHRRDPVEVQLTTLLEMEKHFVGTDAMAKSLGKVTCAK
jgi:hypothetical protein